jgi:hypothetical protein
MRTLWGTAIIVALTGSALATAAVGERSAMKVQASTSALYRAVDRSFSAIPMDTPLSRARARLTEQRVGGCERANDCDWLDANRTRHAFYGDTPANMTLFVKAAEASDFNGRTIPALGIGTARDQRTVMANIRRAFPRLAFTCDTLNASGNVGPVECSADVAPGWIQIGFTRRGVLQAVRFDAYQAN